MPLSSRESEPRVERPVRTGLFDSRCMHRPSLTARAAPVNGMRPQVGPKHVRLCARALKTGHPNVMCRQFSCLAGISHFLPVTQRPRLRPRLRLTASAVFSSKIRNRKLQSEARTIRGAHILQQPYREALFLE
jgi:hypothetical protein